MSNELNDIKNDQPDPQKQDLLRALQDELNADHAFEKDSAEGLSEFDSNKLPGTIEQLNTHLQRQLGKKKRQRRKPANDSQIYITAIIILLLIIICFVVVRKIHQQ